MLLELLTYLEQGRIYSIQELAVLLDKDVPSVEAGIEYLVQQHYLQSVCEECPTGCRGCKRTCIRKNQRDIPQRWQRIEK